MEEYNVDKFHVPNWPRVYQTGDQKWKRVWEISLVSEPKDLNKLREAERELSNDEIEVEITWNSNHLLVIVTTNRWALDDDLIWYSYTILTTLNELVGELAMIQGQARNSWRPWFQGKE